MVAHQLIRGLGEGVSRQNSRQLVWVLMLETLGTRLWNFSRLPLKMGTASLRIKSTSGEGGSKEKSVFP